MLYAPLPAIDLKKPLAGAFLDSVDRLPVGEDVWRDGVATPAFIGVDPGGWPGAPCQANYEDDWDLSFQSEDYTLADKETTFSECVTYTFDPFLIYHLIDTHDVPSVYSDGPSQGPTPGEQADRFAGYVDNWMQAQVSAGVARAFYRGAPQDGLVVAGDQRNRIPRVTATDLTAQMGTPVSVHPTTAVAMLLAAYSGCRLTGGAVLHVPPLILPFLVAHGIIAQVGQRYLGPGGVVVVSDPGMASSREMFSDGIGSDSTEYPSTTIDGTYSIGEGEAWMFVTGPVEASVGTPRIPLDREAQFFDVRMNRWLYIVEQPAIFRYDPSCVYAVAAFAPSPGRDEV